MVKLTTQPPKASTSKLIQLRSGFYSIPFKFNNKSSNSNNDTTSEFFIHAKVYTGEINNLLGKEEEEEEEEWIGIEDKDKEEEKDLKENNNNNNKLFLTGLPLNSTEEILIKAFNKLFNNYNNKVLSVKLILPLNNNNSINSLKNQSFESFSSSSNSSNSNSNSIKIQPLFNSNLISNSSSSINSPISAILTFKSLPSLTLPFPSILWPFPSNSITPSYLKLSKQLHNLARPDLSTIIAHSDSWMSALDRKKLDNVIEIKKLSASLSTKPLPLSKSAIKKANGNNNNNNNSNKSKKNSITTGPALPGSAAYALSSHLANVAKSKDRTINPDEIIEEDWTFVSRGGKHGKSLLPDGIKASNISGYGGINVKVARRSKLGEELLNVKGTGEEEVLKGIVGEGFYSFSKADTRRAELTGLKARFEEDKARVSKFRESFASRGGGGGSSSSSSSFRGNSGNRGGFSSSRGGSGSSSRSSRGRGGNGSGSRGGNSGKGERSYKPY